MTSVNEDIIIHIYSFLTYKSKLIFLSSLHKKSRLFNVALTRIFSDLVPITLIKKLNPIYFDHFTNILCNDPYRFSDKSQYFPKRIKKLTFDNYFSKTITINCIPNSVSHLTFGYGFIQDIKKCIPNTVI